VVETLCYKPQSRGFETRWGEWIFWIYLILPAALDPGVHSASNRNEYQEQKKKNVFLGSRARPVRKADNLAAITSRLAIQCGILNTSQPCYCGSFTFFTYQLLLSDLFILTFSIILLYFCSVRYPSQNILCKLLSFKFVNWIHLAQGIIKVSSIRSFWEFIE
jgi:hypothetical protein